MSDFHASSGIIEEQLERYGSYAANTHGGSMRPLFRTHRDMVVIVPPERELEKYDVPLYRDASGNYVLHRIIGFYDGGYLIRGDNTFVTERIPKERVVGVLSEFNRKGRACTVECRGYKLYSRVWCFIYPVRFCIHKFRLFLGRIYRFVFRKNK